MEELQKIEIVGTKITLRDWKLEDLPIYERWNKPGHQWQKLDGPYYQSSTDQSKILTEKLKEQIEHFNFPNPRMKLVIADTETEQLLGLVSSYWESIETNWLCIGIIIYDDTFWGKGIGKEALTLWINYLIDARPEIIRLDMRTWSGNKGLMGLAKSLGFIQEACFRMARIVDGKYYDGLGFGILRAEWDERAKLL